jgi:dihydrolipoyl dehydrogenase
MVKVIGEANTDRLIGMHILGAHASEMMGTGVIAIEKGATMMEMANASYAHPTLSEAIKEALLNALGRAIHF